MTFALGNAKLNLLINDDEFVADTAAAYRELVNQTKALTKQLADENELRKGDIKKSLAEIAANNKQALAEQLKAEKAANDERKKTTQEYAKYNQQIYKEEQAASKQAAAERLANTKSVIKQQVQDLKDYEKAYKAAEDNINDAIKKGNEEKRKAYDTVAKIEQDNLNKSLEGNKAALQQRLDVVKKEIEQQTASLKTYAATAASVQNQITADEQKQLAIRSANTRAALANNIAQQRQLQASLAQAQQPQSGGGLLGLGISNSRVIGTGATLLGFGAIASGAVAARAAILAMNQAIKDSEQSVKALDAGFGDAALVFKKAADENAAAFNRTNSEVEKGTAYFGILQKQYGLTGDQIKALIPLTIKLNQEFGGDQLETFRNVSDAIQGETQALEKFGISLQENAIKNNPLVTESEKKHYSALTATQQAAIRLRVLMDEVSKRKEIDATKTDTLVEATNKWTRANDELFKAMGESTKGAGSVFLDFLAGTEAAIAKLIKRSNEFNTEARKLREERGNNIANAIGFPLTPEEQATVSARLVDKQRQENARLADAVKADYDKSVEAENKRRQDIQKSQNESERQLLEIQLQNAHDARIKDLEDQITVAERAKATQLDTLKEVHDQNTRDREQLEYEREEASKANLARIEENKHAAIEASQDELKAELERIRLAKQADLDALDEQIRQIKIREEHAKKSNEDLHYAQTKLLKDEKQERDDGRKLEDAATEVAVKQVQRRLEEAHKANLERIDKEKTKLSNKHDQEIRDLDKLSNKEDEKHRKIVDNIESELKKKQDAIDKEIRGIEDTARARENANRTSDLTDKVGAAQTELTQAQGTGTPVQINAANQKLIGAIRIGDPVAIKKAQEELVALSGKGNAAILEAQKKLASAQRDLRDEGLKESEDAEKQRLQDKKDSLKDEADAEKKKADDNSRRRKKDIDDSKKAEKEKYDDAVQKLNDRTKQENKRYDNLKNKQDDEVKNVKFATDTKRRIEDEAYDAAIEKENKRYKDEQDNIQATINGEEHGLIPALQRAKHSTEENYSAMDAAAHARYDQEQKDIYDTYDDKEKGLLAAHARAEDAAKHHYALVSGAAAVAYEAARKAVEESYNAKDGKSGIIDKLHELVRETNEKLDQVKDAFKAAAQGLVEPGKGVIAIQWEDATKLADAYFDHVKERAKEGTGVKLKPDEEVDSPSSRRSGGVSQSSGSSPSTTSRGSNSSNGGAAQTSNSQGTNGSANSSVPDQIKQIPPQVNQYSEYAGYDQDIQDATCGPAAITWMSEIAGRNISAKDALAVATSVGWTKERGMAGPASLGRALSSLGIPNSLENASDSNIERLAKARIPFALSVSNSLGGHYYQIYGQNANGGLNVGGSNVYRGGGQRSVMTLQEIKDLKNSTPTQVIVPDKSVYSARDSGYTFRNPTMTMDMRTGGMGIMAEYGPEMLLGRAATQKAQSMGLTRALGMASSSTSNGVSGVDYSQLGAMLSDINIGSGSNNSSSKGGDTFMYNGVAPDEIFKKWRADQRRQRVLRGV